MVKINVTIKNQVNIYNSCEEILIIIYKVDVKKLFPKDARSVVYSSHTFKFISCILLPKLKSILLYCKCE